MIRLVSIAIAFNWSLALAQDTTRVTTYFDTEKYILTTRSQGILDSFLLQVPDRQSVLYVYGYCDKRGSGSYNDQLAKNRVQSVAAYIISHSGSRTYNLELQSFGERKPVNSNANEAEMALNRRVEIGYFNSSTLKDKIRDSADVGTEITLPTINFVGGRHQFLPESYPMLEQLLDVMNSFPGLVIEVQGHICCQPDHREGLDIETGLNNLSAARAAAVEDYLIQKGISASRITSRGFGHSMPLYPYPEKSPAEETANRRVAIKIIRRN
jgi:outer membrane protein OmpA-like peptidoglycan-associated protein